MIHPSRRGLVRAVLLAALATAPVLTAGPAQAQFYRYGGYGGHGYGGYGYGGGWRGYGYGYGYGGYYVPRPVFVAPPVIYAPPPVYVAPVPLPVWSPAPMVRRPVRHARAVARPVPPCTCNIAPASAAGPLLGPLPALRPAPQAPLTPAPASAPASAPPNNLYPPERTEALPHIGD